MTSDRQESLKRRMTDAAVKIAEASVTPIMITRDNSLLQQGTGTLFQLCNHKVMVTAAHVFHHLAEEDWIPHLLDSGKTTEQVRHAQLFGVTKMFGDPFDVAVTILDHRTTDLLPNRVFLPFSDININTVLPGAFCVGGFPAALGLADRESNQICGCMICTKLYTGSTLKFSGKYDPDWHILIDRMEEKGCTDREGNVTALPDDLRAASGSPLLQTYEDGHLFDEWDPKHIRVVGVLTGGWREALMATRGAVVLACAYNLFPELRADLDAIGMVPIQIPKLAAYYG